MKDRLKILRKELRLTQQELADRVGISRGNIAAYEVGKNSPSDAVISLICREFNVNEVWLRNGSGSMFQERSEEGEIKSLVSSLLDPNRDKMYDVIIEFMKVYTSLSPNSQKALNELADKLLEKLGKQQAAKEEIDVVSTPFGDIPKNPEDLERLYPPVERPGRKTS